MDLFAKLFVASSLFYLLAGSSLGLAMVLHPTEWRQMEYYLIAAHTHLNLLGWVSMMIYGVSYHVLPRFSGRPLYSKKLAWAHFVLAQAGLIGMSVFFFLNRLQEMAWKKELALSGALTWISICLFVFNLLKTLVSPQNQERS